MRNRLTVLDLFILCCLDRGLRTTYDLQRQTGLSLGASVPALKRLLKFGYVRTSPVGSGRRLRNEFTPTLAGMKKFQRDWGLYLADEVPIADTDSILRVVEISTRGKATKKSIGEFLLRAAASKSELADRHSAVVRQGSHASGFAYVDLRIRIDEARARCEADVLGRIAESLLDEGRTRRTRSTNRRE